MFFFLLQKNLLQNNDDFFRFFFFSRAYIKEKKMCFLCLPPFNSLLSLLNLLLCINQTHNAPLSKSQLLFFFHLFIPPCERNWFKQNKFNKLSHLFRSFIVTNNKTTSLLKKWCNMFSLKGEKPSKSCSSVVYYSSQPTPFVSPLSVLCFTFLYSPKINFPHFMVYFLELKKRRSSVLHSEVNQYPHPHSHRLISFFGFILQRKYFYQFILPFLPLNHFQNHIFCFPFCHFSFPRFWLHAVSCDILLSFWISVFDSFIQHRMVEWKQVSELVSIKLLAGYSGWMKGFGIDSMPSAGQMRTTAVPRHTTSPNCLVSSVSL